MVNLIGAIIISAVIGFLAGHFTSQGADPAPVSLKEAVTGDLDAPPAQFNLPRPPRPEKIEKKTDPVMCEKGVSLQEQMSRLKFSELQSICREAETDWQKRNVDGYAPRASRNSPEFARNLQDFFEYSRDSFQSSAYWRGEATISKGEWIVAVEIFVNFFEGKEPLAIAPPISVLQLNDPAQLCQSVSPFFTVNGRSLSIGAVAGCGEPPRRKGESFYVAWETFGDPNLSPVLSALLIPVPGARVGALEYLDSQTGNWTEEPSFHWSSSTPQEYERARDRHMKKSEAN